MSKTLTALRTGARGRAGARSSCRDKENGAPERSKSRSRSRKERGIESMEFYFDHEKLGVYQVAIEFVAWSEILLEDCKGKAASAKKHLDEASSSIPNNIAKGNGKWSKKDR